MADDRHEGAPEDPLVKSSEEAEKKAGSAKEARAANLFDLRRIIGALFVLYGIVLTILGLLDSSAEVARAAGVRINLWAGLGMLILGGICLAWSLLHPLSAELAEAEEGAGEPATERG